MGFVKEADNNKRDVVVEHQSFVRMQTILHPSDFKLDKKRENQNCWLCEGWFDYKFQVDADDLDEKFYQVWLHLSIDGFKPMSMKKNKD